MLWVNYKRSYKFVGSTAGMLITVVFVILFFVLLGFIFSNQINEAKQRSKNRRSISGTPSNKTELIERNLASLDQSINAENPVSLPITKAQQDLIETELRNEFGIENLADFVTTPASADDENLVIDGSFENLIKCPSFDLIDSELMVNWDVPIDLNIDFKDTPDVYNRCVTTYPNHVYGKHFAKDGQGYIGVYTYADSSLFADWQFREYWVGEIKDIKKGNNYELSFYVGASEQLSLFSNFGVALTTTKTIQSNSDVIDRSTIDGVVYDITLFNSSGKSEPTIYIYNEDKQIEMLTDSYEIESAQYENLINGWHRIVFRFVPSEEYNFITIGNFMRNEDSVVFNSGFGNSVYKDQLSYLVFDNFKLEKVSDKEIAAEHFVIDNKSNDSIVNEDSASDYINNKPGKLFWRFRDIDVNILLGIISFFTFATILIYWFR